MMIVSFKLLFVLIRDLLCCVRVPCCNCWHVNCLICFSAIHAREPDTTLSKLSFEGLDDYSNYTQQLPVEHTDWQPTKWWLTAYYWTWWLTACCCIYWLTAVYCVSPVCFVLPIHIMRYPHSSTCVTLIAVIVHRFVWNTIRPICIQQVYFIYCMMIFKVSSA